MSEISLRNSVDHTFIHLVLHFYGMFINSELCHRLLSDLDIDFFMHFICLFLL